MAGTSSFLSRNGSKPFQKGPLRIRATWERRPLSVFSCGSTRNQFRAMPRGKASKRRVFLSGFQTTFADYTCPAGRPAPARSHEVQVTSTGIHGYYRNGLRTSVIALAIITPEQKCHFLKLVVERIRVGDQNSFEIQVIIPRLEKWPPGSVHASARLHAVCW